MRNLITPPQRRALAIFGGAALVAWLADFATKWLALTHLQQGEPVPVIPNVLNWTLVFNSGAAFSLGSGFTWIFTIIASVVAVALCWYALRVEDWRWALVLGVLLGGTLGNLGDRLFRAPGFAVGHVVDFIQVPWFSIMNVADVWISLSVIGLIALVVFGVAPTRQELEEGVEEREHAD